MSSTIENGRARSVTAPIDRLSAVTPSDSADLPDGVCRGLFIGVAGDVAIEDRFGGRVVLASGTAQYHPVRVRRVLATDTTAERIVALY